MAEPVEERTPWVGGEPERDGLIGASRPTSSAGGEDGGNFASPHLVPGQGNAEGKKRRKPMRTIESMKTSYLKRVRVLHGGVWHDAMVVRMQQSKVAAAIGDGVFVPLEQGNKGTTWAPWTWHDDASGCPCYECSSRNAGRIALAERIKLRDERRAKRRSEKFVPIDLTDKRNIVNDDASLPRGWRRNRLPLHPKTYRDRLFCGKCKLIGHLSGDPDLCLRHVDDVLGGQAVDHDAGIVDD